MSTDIVIVGGGVMGCSTAWHLATLSGERPRITVVEPDPSYRFASSALSLSSIRQQFTSRINIEMSRYTLELLRDSTPLAIPGEDAPDLQFVERGYLFLGREEDAACLEDAHSVQREAGVEVELLRPEDFDRLPWLSCHDLAIASFGRRDEGWFDGYSLLRALRAAARNAGVRFEQAAVTEIKAGAAGDWNILLSSGERLNCQHVVNAAGPWASMVAAMAGVDLPVRAQKRCVFVVDAPDADPSWPLVIDPDGFYFRPEGKTFLVGAPAPDAYHASDDFDVDYDLFDMLWPTLAARAPAFERLRLTNAWAGHYEMNVLDGNAVIGQAPARNFWLINGFSGHGLQHAPAAGRRLAELILFGAYRTLDLSSLAFDRFSAGRGIPEAHII